MGFFMVSPGEIFWTVPAGDYKRLRREAQMAADKSTPIAADER
jgi:hypothetical protein